ncbi:hypothetical protein B0H17DRAFT_1256502 [Mycena rosella]|uniref:Rhodanese domain-containing protein n=1 Tax=Mycena rosella TaxID=1033263 RepID=A0AAD7CU96_MYCRO|nr:hypothetical protein B0H17DRAFT_1256502 [Mycena rosella]
MLQRQRAITSSLIVDRTDRVGIRLAAGARAVVLGIRRVFVSHSSCSCGHSSRVRARNSAALRAEQEHEALHVPAPPYRVLPHLRRRPVAAALHAFGLYNATDVVGGFRACRAAGLDVADGARRMGTASGDSSIMYMSPPAIPKVNKPVTSSEFNQFPLRLLLSKCLRRESGQPVTNSCVHTVRAQYSPGGASDEGARLRLRASNNTITCAEFSGFKKPPCVEYSSRI